TRTVIEANDSGSVTMTRQNGGVARHSYQRKSVSTLSSSDAPFTYNTTGSLNTARARHSATLLSNGKVLVAGGLDSGLNPSASAELYDPANGTWTATGSFNTARGYHTAT